VTPSAGLLGGLGSDVGVDEDASCVEGGHFAQEVVAAEYT